MYHRQVTCKVRINITHFGKFEGLTSFHSYINRSSTAIKRSYYEDEAADACKIGCSDDSRVELAGKNVSDREHAVTIRSVGARRCNAYFISRWRPRRQTRLVARRSDGREDSWNSGDSRLEMLWLLHAQCRLKDCRCSSCGVLLCSWRR